MGEAYLRGNNLMNWHTANRRRKRKERREREARAFVAWCKAGGPGEIAVAILEATAALQAFCEFSADWLGSLRREAHKSEANNYG
jgi:hypothetical protein